MVHNQIITLHFFLTSLKTGTLCGQDGHPIPNSSPPPPSDHDSSPNNWAPYGNHVQFKAADFLFSWQQMSASSIDFQLKLWAATLVVHGDIPPFASHKDMYEKIDVTCLGDTPWESFTLKYEGTRPDHDVPDWIWPSTRSGFKTLSCLSTTCCPILTSRMSLTMHPFKNMMGLTTIDSKTSCRITMLGNNA